MGLSTGPTGGHLLLGPGSKSSAHSYLALYGGVGKRTFSPQMKPWLLRFRIFDQGK